ncbi:helicase-like transcription factor CHR28 isoform X2 [Phalaenopsis equestris]|nr:helicase-like transcription factor CHR28 isoform X2 [Phalaenopsis equestris]
MDSMNECYDEIPMEGEYPDNLSISLESLFKILDEEPAPPIGDSLGIPSGSHSEQLVCQRNLEALHPRCEPRPSELDHPNSLDESAFQPPVEPWFEPPVELKRTSNSFNGIFFGEPLDERNLRSSNLVESNDSYGDSFGNIVTEDMNFNKLQNNSPNCRFSKGTADEFGHFYQQQVNATSDTVLIGLKDHLETQDCETPLQNGFSKFFTDSDAISSPCLLQSGERSLANIMLREYGSISERCSHMNRNAILDSAVQSENVHSSSVACNLENLALQQHYKFSSNMNSTERIKVSHDTNNSPLMASGDLLVSADAVLRPRFSEKVRGLPHDQVVKFYGKNGEQTQFFFFKASGECVVQEQSLHSSLPEYSTVEMDLALSQQYKTSSDIDSTERIKHSHDANSSSLASPGDFLVSVKAVSCPSLPVKVRGLLHHNATQFHGKNGEGAQLFLSKDSVNCTFQEQSPHSSVLEDSAEDMDALLPCGLYAQQYRCEDMGMMTDSSTDSSPLPYNHKPMLLNLDGSSTESVRQLISDHKMILQRKEQKYLIKDKKQFQISPTQQQQHQLPKVSKIAIQSKHSREMSTLDEDVDLYILDDISDPVPRAPPPVLLNLNQMKQRCTFSNFHAGPGSLKSRHDDERLTFQLALQGLSQPKAEASPPDGVLAVPLLRHQRIALSWMVQMETAGLNCSGGILADDQGLGKTVSTIALILTERSPSSASCSVTQKKCKFEPLNLDDEDADGDPVFDANGMKQLPDSGPSMHIKPMKIANSFVPIKGRPAAGTLVVCPTSVLRQWADELQNKITSKANLSFLVYHGTNRTKSPYELAKFDVVLTTYAIVSMEVPKKPLLDKDDMEGGKQDGCGIFVGNLASKKRKDSPNASSKTPKKKIASGNSELESAWPLSKVGWFRVILDEAQSIKNHRTQVARACWGLRAKRRWCLSGTPIQNAIDDLYSYFRFLRYDPYAAYKSFCSTIKIPISRNPSNGYKKLQAVLKTVMLRRTKGTLLDGKPVITLPPKTVVLRRVDFSDKEHEFYLALEAESREQFKVYADAGTVKQNYVNILLMLLRLRQACDHPLLVKGHDSNSVWKSSLNTAKKLPKDKLMDLLSCLEACLAICTICNDPPENAVVSICGHVFCNQCICEHLTGDDNICPSANCREKLSSCSVFSMDTLKSCLFEQPGLDFFPDNSISAQDGSEICEEILISHSSKIKAALEILCSLPPSKTSPSLCKSAKPYNDSSVFSEDAASTISVGCSSDNSAEQQSNQQTSNVKQTEKAIVFSQWTRMLDLMEVSLKDSHILYRRLDGTMSIAAREKAIKDFNMLPEVTVIIMSLKAASLGLNMVAACHVILLDLWWNPTTEDQAVDRAHRIGQTRPVTVSRLTVNNTVEDRILALQEKKRKMVAYAFGEDQFGSRQTRLTVEDLKYLFMA